MASFTITTLTKAGINILAELVAGSNLEFTSIKIGDGAITTENPINLTDVINTVITVPVTSVTAHSDGSAVVTGVFNNSDLDTGFFYRELGIFAKDPATLQPVLFAYANAAQNAEWVPPSGAQTIVEKQIEITTIIGNATSVSCSLASGIYSTQSALEATKLELQEDLTEHENDTEAHSGLFVGLAGDEVIDGVKTFNGEIKTPNTFTNESTAAALTVAAYKVPASNLINPEAMQSRHTCLRSGNGQDLSYQRFAYAIDGTATAEIVASTYSNEGVRQFGGLTANITRDGVQTYTAGLKNIVTSVGGAAADSTGNVGKSVVIETWTDGANWYRLYSDGWCEQGGTLTRTAWNSPITFFKAFKDTNYTFNAVSSHFSAGYYLIGINYLNTQKTVSNITVLQSGATSQGSSYMQATNTEIMWIAKGFIN